MSCITNFLTDTTDASSTVSHRVEPVFREFFKQIVDTCKAVPERQYLVCPPMYRPHPVWYRDGQAEILSCFSTAFAQNALSIKNLHAMPGFPNATLESDGVHLTAYSGMEFVLHLFDRSQMILKNIGSSPEVRSSEASETVRLLADQVIALQQDHQRLSSAFDTKVAVDAELACFRANERSEDSLLLSGMPKLPSGLSGKAWQDQAIQAVQKTLSEIVGHPVRVVVVHNSTGRGVKSTTSYTVQLDSVESSREVRRKFSYYFAGGNDARPASLRSVSISNVVTKETRVRIALMKLLGKKYLDSNSGSRVKVIGYEPRPLLRIIPPQEASDRRPKTFTFIEAVTKLSKTLVDDDLAEIATKASTMFGGRLRELFIILSDDMVQPNKSRKRGPDDLSEDEPPRQRQATV